MQIILVSDRLATAKTITLGLRHLLIALFGLLLVVFATSSLFSFVALQKLPEIKLPFAQSLVLSLRAGEMEKSQEFVRENINALAVRVGQMQAQLMRLDSLGERIGSMVGVRAADVMSLEKPGQGGPLVTGARSLSAAELEQEIAALSRKVEARKEYLGLVENQLLEERVRQDLLPTTLPLEAAWDSSSYGWRIDPFTGERALHAGADFTAPKGTPVVAAAGGVVAVAEYHPSYGHYIDIDHGNELTTRYAHASKLLVKPGMIVKPGQKIAEVGSTGRSTGPHLHFEVRLGDVPQNPNRFLWTAQQSGKRVAAAR